jgi:hypothetical protein
LSTQEKVAGWTTLSAMFTRQEMIPIRTVQKLYSWNNSQMVRQSVMVGTQVLLEGRIIYNPNSSLSKVMQVIIKKIFNKRTINRIEKELEKEKAKIDPATFKQAQEELELLKISMRVFKEHKSRGRPKAKKGVRGRPTDTGISES